MVSASWALGALDFPPAWLSSILSVMIHAPPSGH